ncbi:hypothetical protein [Methylorubrum thiocyanatum]
MAHGITNPTIAGRETTIVAVCNAKGCGHHAVIDIARLPPGTQRGQIAQRARCTACGTRGAQIMRNIAADYERMEAASGFSAKYPGGEG